MSENDIRIDYANLPTPEDGFLVTLFITVRKIARSRTFYSEVLGGTVVLEENPCIVKLANSWIIMNPGGPPVRIRKSCERAWQVAGVAGSRTDAGDYPGSQPGCWGGVAQAWRSSGLAVQGRNRSSAGPVGGFPPLCPHWSR